MLNNALAEKVKKSSTNRFAIDLQKNTIFKDDFTLFKNANFVHIVRKLPYQFELEGFVTTACNIHYVYNHFHQ